MGFGNIFLLKCLYREVLRMFKDSNEKWSFVRGCSLLGISLLLLLAVLFSGCAPQDDIDDGQADILTLVNPSTMAPSWTQEHMMLLSNFFRPAGKITVRPMSAPPIEATKPKAPFLRTRWAE